ncbi:MAG: hypothetical protein LBK13_02490 [Spirochaetales bacterium]|jgi:hypothetical protein|nr:hypothetical protein [Spirochaetales bacterium]
MDPAGLIDKIFQAVINIDFGRKGMATDGEEHNGRIHYENGIYTALSAFKEAQTSADTQTIILVELAFLQQELQFCHETDTDTKSSLAQAIQSFEDALRSLEAVEDAAMYQGAEKTWPTIPKYRIQSFPKDAFHLACIAHRTRLRNVLRASGINMIEKAVLNQRAANMTTAQSKYIEKQKNAMFADNH